MNYDEYLRSEQKKKEDRVFLEFNKKHGIDPLSHIYATQGTVLTLLMGAAILGLIVWLMS
jgi:hypothetical protein